MRVPETPSSSGVPQTPSSSGGSKNPRQYQGFCKPPVSCTFSGVDKNLH